MTSDAIKALADNVRRLMDAHKLTQNQFATRAGVSQKSISDLLNYGGNVSKEPRLGTIEKIAKGFEIPPWQLQIPGLPVELLRDHAVGKVLENYRDAGPIGREHIRRIAESEVRYTLLKGAAGE